MLLLQLILTAINTARSAFFAVTFYASFFDAYSIECSLDKVQSAVLLKVRAHMSWEGSYGLGGADKGKERSLDKVQSVVLLKVRRRAGWAGLAGGNNGSLKAVRQGADCGAAQQGEGWAE